ncbi:MAG: hypothetical protein WBE18_08645, partial [Gammaproteobacteria bacterium]
SKEYEGAMIAIQQLSEMSDFQNRPMILAELYLSFINKIILEEDEEQQDQERQSRLIRAAIDQAIQKAQIVGVNSELAEYLFYIGSTWLNYYEEFRSDSCTLYLEAIRLSEPEDINAIIKYKLAVAKYYYVSMESEKSQNVLEEIRAIPLSDLQNKTFVFVIEACLTLTGIYLSTDKNEKAIECAKQACQAVLGLHNDKGIGEEFLKVAVQFFGKYESLPPEFIEPTTLLYQHGIRLSNKKEGVDWDIIQAYENLGFCYYQKNLLDMADGCFRMQIKLSSLTACDKFLELDDLTTAYEYLGKRSRITPGTQLLYQYAEDTFKLDEDRKDKDITIQKFMKIYDAIIIFLESYPYLSLSENQLSEHCISLRNLKEFMQLVCDIFSKTDYPKVVFKNFYKILRALTFLKSGSKN